MEQPIQEEEAGDVQLRILAMELASGQNLAHWHVAITAYVQSKLASTMVEDIRQGFGDVRASSWAALKRAS